MLFINRILPLRPLHLYRDLDRWLLNGIVVTESLESTGQNLYPQLAVGHAIEAGFALCIGLDLESASGLLSVLLHRMHHHTGVSDRLAVVVADDDEIQNGHLVVLR